MIPVVLSGGSGTRLWPVSRTAVPKQFCDLFDESLLAKTLRRLRPLGPPAIVGARETEILARRVLRDLELPADRAVFEPVGRNTAPAVALLCHLMLLRGEGREVVGVFPADHLVEDDEVFRRAVLLAERCAAEGPVVATLGVRPTRPETGYGYIELTDRAVAEEPAAGERADPLVAYAARGFREKPDAETARRYLEAGGFLWNAGMFVFRVEVMAGLFERLMPETWSAIRSVEADLSNLDAVYAGLEPESLDYGIMEHVEDHVSVPCAIGWSDVGSWDEVSRLMPTARSTVEVGGGDNFVVAHRGRLVGLVGVEDLLVVDTADALLVTRRGASQRVKELVAALHEEGRREVAEHAYDLRPWGRFEVLRDTERFKSKVIEVDPGQRLSYQSHRHRSEHWIIVRGHPEVVLDGEVLRPTPGDHVHIPQGAKHRIRNPTGEPVTFVEVQLGSYFGEDDIVRYEDDYDRT
ncbi:MAG: mannose-1-phosphate guanylyltransferase/mannose-6-phosphate isomerase [Acidobacteriota bacterium]|jgi:mannose-1-phosphate guanylyltransferase/mannose-1-phosphate guanylyltransferase/mannose-6-phosphate isomerase